MNKIADVKTHLYGKAVDLILYQTKYADGAPCLMLYEGGIPYARVSVNVPEYRHLLSEDSFFIKTWSENEKVAQAVFNLGLFEDTGLKIKVSQFSSAPVWRLKKVGA